MKKIKVTVELDERELAQRNMVAKTLAQGGFPEQTVDAYLWRCGLVAQCQRIEQHRIEQERVEFQERIAEKGGKE